MPRLLACFLLLLGTAQAAEPPGRLLLQETAAVAPAGRVHLDLTAPDHPLLRTAPALLRVGTGAGEWHLARTALGFKYPAAPGLALYGRLGIDSDAGRSDARVGLAWSRQRGRLGLNLNPELRKQGERAHLDLNGAAHLPLGRLPGHPRPLVAIGEVSLSDAPGAELASAFGLRWRPHPALTADLVLLASGSLGHALGTPLALRLTLDL